MKQLRYFYTFINTIQLAYDFAWKIGSDFAPGRLNSNQSEFKQFKSYKLIIPQALHYTLSWISKVAGDK